MVVEMIKNLLKKLGFMSNELDLIDFSFISIHKCYPESFTESLVLDNLAILSPEYFLTSFWLQFRFFQ